MSATRPRLAAEDRRAAVLDTACRIFSKSSYRGATTAEIAREMGVTEPVLYRHFSSKRELYLACLAQSWAQVRAAWELALEAEPDPKEWVGTIGSTYISLRADEKVLLVDLWVQALSEASEDQKIRRYVRDQLREVHDFVADVIRRSQEAGGVLADRDPDGEAWIFLSLGLLSTFDRRLGCLVGGDHLACVFASRRRWMLGDDRA